MSDVICKECGKEWPENCEQAIAIELYDKCIVCMEGECDFDKIVKIQKERVGDKPFCENCGVFHHPGDNTLCSK